MRCIFRGTNKKITDDVFRDMAKYMLGLLMTPEEMNTLELKIGFDHNGREYAGYKGFTHHDYGNSYVIWIRPSMSRHEQKLAFAHELVHVKQFVRGELCKNSGRVLSKSLQRLNPTKSKHYFDDPAEIEAHGRAIGLVCRWDECTRQKSTKRI